MPTRVLIADDSALTRVVLRDLLARDPLIEIVAEAADGRQAVQLTRELRPDLVIMDIMMPGMDGLDATSEIMADCPTPILVLSANTDSQDSRNAFAAIRLGALDVMEKPSGVISDAFDTIAVQLIARVKSLSRIRVIHHFRGMARRQPRETLPPAACLPAGIYSLLAIGASTGGPQAVLSLLRELPANLTATILVVQHIADGFAPGFAAWLRRETGHRIALAEEGQELPPGQILIAPNGRHLTVADRRVRLSDAAPLHNCRPAVDALFQSLADQGLAPATVAVLLTGMGQDGARGLLALKQAGALTLAQDQASSAIFGMPKAAIECGAVDRVLPLAQMPETLRALFAAG
ncbi:MAG: chemotaxis-specific protein-glutamate methyltransferase CheB [Desulfuromonadales bacterium]|nr:chemotaxis-specific protein-glutamate methyltransferase CheB [Desulfuromonadales bacterium]